MTQGRVLKGLERDRVVIRASAMRVIRHILNWPKARMRDTRRDWLAPPPLSAFRRLEPLGFGLSDDDWWIFHPDDCQPDLVWPLDVGTIAETAGEEQTLAFSRTTTVTPKQTRGYASKFSPFMVRIDHAQVLDGQLVTAAGIYVWLGGEWVNAENRTIWSGRSAEVAIPDRSNVLPKVDRDKPRLASAIALRQRYEWAVALGLETSPSIRFATDPTGIKDIFRIRDLPEGRDRRDALMTWVTDHWRQDREDPDIETYVRKHLRGATAFTWQGMRGEIIPSQFDLDQRDRLIATRESMRIAGADKRLKQHATSEA